MKGTTSEFYTEKGKLMSHPKGVNQISRGLVLLSKSPGKCWNSAFLETEHVTAILYNCVLFNRRSFDSRYLTAALNITQSSNRRTFNPLQIFLSPILHIHPRSSDLNSSVYFLEMHDSCLISMTRKRGKIVGYDLEKGMRKCICDLRFSRQ
jgi:hypothetical protein